jgi:hypothetical protein
MNYKKIKITSEEILEARQERIKELSKLLCDKNSMTPAQFRELLCEIRHNYTVLLAIRSVEGQTSGTGAYMAVIEKTFYMLQAVEGRVPKSQVEVTHRINGEVQKEIQKLLMDKANIDGILEIESTLLASQVPDA